MRLVVFFWDPVWIDESGELASNATFVLILNALSHLVDLAVISPRSGEIERGERATLIPLQVEAAVVSMLSHPVSFLRKVRHALCQAGIDQDTRILFVDAGMPTLLVGSRISPKEMCYLYLRGDDAHELVARSKGLLKRVVARLLSGLIRVGRSWLVEKVHVIGAGGTPVPGLLNSRKVYSFFPNSLKKSDLDQLPDPLICEEPGPGVVRLIGIGRLTTIKRFDRLFHTAVLLHKIYGRRCTVDLLGDGPEYAALAELAKRIHGDGVRIRMRGHQAKGMVLDALASASVLLITSDREGFPKVVPEALALGIPIVSTPVGSMKTFLGEHKVGLVAQSMAPAALAESVNTLLADDGVLIEMRRSARLLARRLTLEDQCRQLVEHIFGDLSCESLS